MKRILNWLGLFTRPQYEKLLVTIKDLREENKKERRAKGVAQTIVTEMKKIHQNMPFQFDILINKYNKDQINAFNYKIINKVRNTPEMVDLLDIWLNRIVDAKKVKNGNQD